MDGKEKVPSHAEYESEYSKRLAQELDCFKSCIELMSKVEGLHPFIVDLFREVETPFLGQDVTSGLSDDLKR